MKYLSTILILFINISAFSQKQFVDYNYNPMTEKEFKELVNSKAAFEISAEEKNTRRLVRRNQYGIVNNVNAFYDVIDKNLEKKIKRFDYIIVFYNPGEDSCNTSGKKYTKNKAYYRRIKKYRETREQQLKDIIPNFKVLYINQVDAENIDSKLENYRDPERLFEKLFFKYHYPCSSIVVVAPDGRYASYLGESGQKTPYYLLMTLIKNEDNPIWISNEK